MPNAIAEASSGQTQIKIKLSFSLECRPGSGHCLCIMSHKPNVFSPPGTPLLDRTVGELVAERPGRARVFQSFGIDFCCQGGRTVREACEGKGLPFQTVVEQLEAEQADPAAPAQNPAELSPEALAAYIVETHHAFLRRELPRLHAMSQRVAQVHGGHTPSLIEMFHVFTGMAAELSNHLAKEEQVLFPAVAAMSRGESYRGLLNEPIDCMIHEHEEAGAALARLRELSHGFQPPAEACNTYRALFAGLHDLEEDLHRHIHLENAVLFPAARAMAEGKE
jgi:regulator of cell morphogenesis and NO signaling